MSNLIPANRDPNVLIKEIAKNCIHVRLTRTDYDPNNVEIHSDVEKIAVFSIKEFEDMESRKDPRKTRMPIDWVRVSGFTKAFVIHDGRLEPEPEAEPPVTQPEQSLDAAVKEAVKKGERRANVRQNLKNMGKEIA